MPESMINSSPNQEAQKEVLWVRIKNLWEVIWSKDTFTKISLGIIVLVLLLTPIIVSQKTNLFSRASTSLFNNCTPIPTGLTQQQIQQLSQTGKVKWCGALPNLSFDNLTWGKQDIAYVSSGNASDANMNFSTLWTSQETLSGTPGSVSSWLAYNLSQIPHRRVDIVWYNDLGGTPDLETSPPLATYNHEIVTNPSKKAENLPLDYTIEGNKQESPIGGSVPTTGWVTLITVQDNHLHSRQHVIDLTGYNWVRMTIQAIDQDSVLGTIHASLHMDVYDASSFASDQPIAQDILLVGDSLIATSILQDKAQLQAPNSSVQELIQQETGIFPIVENAGNGGFTAGDVLTLNTNGVRRIDSWLSFFPGKYVAVSFGTNEILQSPTICGVSSQNYANYKAVINAVLAKGKVPIVPTVMWGPNATISQCVQTFNTNIIQKLYTEFGSKLLHGPDFYLIFVNMPSSQYDSLGVHLVGQPRATYRKAWADMLSQLLLPQPSLPTHGTFIYRLHNSRFRDYLYSADQATITAAANNGYTVEATAFDAYTAPNPQEDIYPIYQLHKNYTIPNGPAGNAAAVDHFYTISQDEVTKEEQNGYILDGKPFYGYTFQNAFDQPVYHLTTFNGSTNFYTQSRSERDIAISQYHFVYAGIAWYSLPLTNQTVTTVSITPVVKVTGGTSNTIPTNVPHPTGLPPIGAPPSLQ